MELHLQVALPWLHRPSIRVRPNYYYLPVCGHYPYFFLGLSTVSWHVALSRPLRDRCPGHSLRDVPTTPINMLTTHGRYTVLTRALLPRVGWVICGLAVPLAIAFARAFPDAKESTSIGAAPLVLVCLRSKQASVSALNNAYVVRRAA